MNKSNRFEGGLLVNGEELLAMRNLLAQTTAEMALLKKAVNSQQLVIFEMGKNLKSLTQQFQMLRDYVDKKKINGGKRQ